jgi:type I restriction enzyme R subunit
LPNATYIGFTGTPFSGKDRSTIEVFGNYNVLGFDIAGV